MLKKVLLNLFIFACLSSSLVYADVLAPSEDACRKQTAGEACTMDGKSGICEKSTCSRLDYSKGSPPQGSVSYVCYKCNTSAESTGCSAVGGTLVPILSLCGGLLLVAWLRRVRA